ncbi:hypothetical protein [Actinomadura macrotermitis]|uniref:Uncharacterized protein n=1 Tax=Actinomadura macrotermitis TaxID=2585200 RepID=A0A7K0BZT5_9ACTN|nr:hypothetical protein [Actinomadura macrotermitis]MQY06725.1 hypothetical protein [Actinomadura macrotermitis]
MRFGMELSSIQRIECIRIEDHEGWHGWQSIPGAVIGTWHGEQATRITGLLDGLSECGLTRCFLPGYGIRAYDAERLALEVAFCFRCDNLLVLGGGANDLRGFKTKNRKAQHLLRAFQAWG